MPSSRTVRGTNSSDERTQTGRPIAVATSRRGGKRPRNTDSAGTAKTLPRTIMPGARYVPSSTGNTAHKPGREPSSGGRRIPDRLGSSEDNRPDTGRGPSSRPVSGVNRGTFYVEGLRGKTENAWFRAMWETCRETHCSLFALLQRAVPPGPYNSGRLVVSQPRNSSYSGWGFDRPGIATARLLPKNTFHSKHD